MQKVEFKVKVDGEELTYSVVMPSGKVRKEAREYRDLIFKKKMLEVDENGKNTAFLSSKAYNLLKEMGLWSDELETRVQELSKQIEDKLHILSKGKSEEVPTKERLREIIIKEIKPLRAEQFALLAQSKQLDSITIENIANEAEIDYLVAKCSRNEQTAPAFTSLDDYYGKASEAYADECKNQLLILMGISDPNWANSLPENKLLKKYGFVDDKGRYVIDGKLVNVDGKPLNEKGFLINEKGEQVNDYGDLIDDEGNLLEVAPF